MPGLAGIVFKRRIEPEIGGHILKVMMRKIIYGNNELTDSYHDENIALGRVSLGAINTSTQPYWSHDKRYCLFMDGEIFDYENEKKKLISKGLHFEMNTEEEVALRLFEFYGKKMVHHIKGIFALAIYDFKEQKLFLINDRYGIRKVYIYENSEYFIFSSELKAILASGFVQRNLNESSVIDMLSFHFIMGDKTFFEDVSLLPRASFWEISSEDVDKSQYWDYPRETQLSDKSYQDLMEEGSHHFRQAIHRSLKSDRKIGITLSGGLDSRMLLAHSSELRDDIISYHFGFPDWPETKIAEKIAKTCNSEFMLFDNRESKLSDAFIKGSIVGDGHYAVEQYIYMPWIELIEQSRTNYIFHGIGPDMLYNPYTREEDLLLRKQKFIKLLPELLLEHFVFDTAGNFDGILNPDWIKKLTHLPKDHFLEEVRKFDPVDVNSFEYYFYFNNRGRRYVLGTSEAHRGTIEYGFPFLDYDFFDFSMKIPPEYRFEKKLYRSIFLNDFPELSRIPNAHTGLPLDNYSYRRKNTVDYLSRYLYYLNRLTKGKIDFFSSRGFFDYKYRNDKELRNRVLEILHNPSVLELGLFSKNGIDKLDRMQMSGKNLYSIFSALVTISLFYSEFFVEHTGVMNTHMNSINTIQHRQ